MRRGDQTRVTKQLLDVPSLAPQPLSREGVDRDVVLGKIGEVLVEVGKRVGVLHFRGKRM